MTSGKFTIVGSNLYLDHLFRGIQKPQHTPHIGLFLTSPTQQGPGSEPGGSGYLRAALTSAIFAAPSDGETTTAEDIIFPRSTGWTGTVVGAGLFDSSSAGRCLAYWHAEDFELIEDKDKLIILAGGLTHRFLTGLWSTNLKNAILNDLYRSIPLPLYPSVYVASYTSSSTPTAGGTEPSGGGYIRQPLATNGTNFSPPASGEIKASVATRFPLATADQGNQSHWGLHTEQSGGQFILGGTLAPPKAIAVGDQLELSTGEIRISLDKVGV